jgi:hypothetical protein
MGRIEHPLLDGDKPPIRPKTAARYNHTIPQKSHKCFNLRLTKGARAALLKGVPANLR